jgi:hypothetical protein
MPSINITALGIRSSSRATTWLNSSSRCKSGRIAAKDGDISGSPAEGGLQPRRVFDLNE